MTCVSVAGRIGITTRDMIPVVRFLRDGRASTRNHLPERAANTLHRVRQVLHYKLSRNPDYAIARTPDLLIPAIDDAARQAGIDDRKGFGKFIESEEQAIGQPPSDNFTYDELLDLAEVKAGAN